MQEQYHVNQNCLVQDCLIRDPFWNRFRECAVQEGIPYQWKALNDALPGDTEPSHCLRNFRIAAGKEKEVK